MRADDKLRAEIDEKVTVLKPKQPAGWRDRLIVRNAAELIGKQINLSTAERIWSARRSKFPSLDRRGAFASAVRLGLRSEAVLS